MKNKKVEFAAYAVPHPSEPYMNVRIQAADEEQEASKLLRHALKRISKTSDVLTETFEKALEDFDN